MAAQFDYFVVFAEMRTGSNFLEANLNQFDGLTCHGEAFNPSFIGYPNSEDILDVTLAQRDRDPGHLIEVIRDKTKGIGGFRFFHDHHPGALDLILNDPRCAKIVLTRNPIESYTSWKIAKATGQWKLTNVEKRKDSPAWFDAEEFKEYLTRLQAFQVRLLKALQTTGQTAFYVAFEDLQDIAVMNGLAAWLGVADRLEGLDKKLKRQNPEPLADKVANFPEMEAALANLDRFNLTRTPNFEPRRGPQVPRYVAAPASALLYLPIRSGPEEVVLEWLASLDGAGRNALQTRFSQNSLRKWMKAKPGHRSFAVIRHPLLRAHTAFCTKILARGPGNFAKIRQALQRVHGLDLPDDPSDSRYDANAHQTAFAAFLKFLKANLNGQTAIRVDAHWASQAQCLQDMSTFALPDMIVREEEMSVYLPALAMQVGHHAPPDTEDASPDEPFTLQEIYSTQLEALARDAYYRDYLIFGFSDWSP
ncbi:sulfotransferase family 2 domain-containing protein [Primorskyibacter flagellatus]|uniref:Sulfotransferase family protein n=1 Tax=Primorskyibacter flagellatus TaxID=1387277 RepID=A0A1W2C022_9RHOB|nr:sulfotransferase family 2 domain-containing protein [Primorskyibacter flagellatus]SMC78426.1 Sulfotransferase family protein [Primorskyibacter flagellatus]